MILAIKVIVITTIIITIVIKYRGRYRTSTTTNMELLVTLLNGQKPLSNMKKSSPSDTAAYSSLNVMNRGKTIPLEFFAWNSPPLDFSRISVTIILINITIMIIIVIITGHTWYSFIFLPNTTPKFDEFLNLRHFSFSSLLSFQCFEKASFVTMELDVVLLPLSLFATFFQFNFLVSHLFNPLLP